MVAMESHWLLWKSMVAMDIHWLLWKSIRDKESHWLLWKVAMKVNGGYGKSLVAMTSHLVFKQSMVGIEGQ
jgi:hypothetical protein